MDEPKWVIGFWPCAADDDADAGDVGDAGDADDDASNGVRINVYPCPMAATAGHSDWN